MHGRLLPMIPVKVKILVASGLKDSKFQGLREFMDLRTRILGGKGFGFGVWGVGISFARFGAGVWGR